MSLSTKTQLATILRQVNQGLFTREQAYHLISDLYCKELNHVALNS